MFLHMEEHHVKFYSHMCGPPRPYQCSVCRRTMETEKQHTGHRWVHVSCLFTFEIDTILDILEANQS